MKTFLFRFSRLLSIISYLVIFIGISLIFIHIEDLLKETYWESEWYTILEFFVMFFLIPITINLTFNWMIFGKVTHWIKIIDEEEK